MLEFVDSVDCAARVVIGVALADAARSAIDKAKEWVALAERAEVDAGFVDSVVSFASGGAGNENQSNQDEREREQLRRRVQQLEAFRKLAAAVADCLNRRLDGLSQPAESSGGSSPRQRAEFRRQLPEFASVMGWIGRSASVYRLLVRQRNPQRIEDFCLAGVGNRQPCDAGLLIHSIFQ